MNRLWPAPDGVDPGDAFPGDHIRESLDTSLRASGLDHFDVLQFHVWSDEWVDRGDWAETALRFVLSEPAVSTVIPGMRSVRNVERNTALSDGRPLTPEQLAVLARHRWERNFYG